MFGGQSKEERRAEIQSLISNGLYDPSSEIPTSVVNLAVVRKVANMWLQELPTVRPFYAIKAGSDLETMKLLHSLGFGFDCASDVEIEAVRTIPGLDCSKDIIFAHPSKFVSHIKRAKDWGVKMTTFDNVDELDKLAELFPEADLLLRIRTQSEKSLFELGKKFGALESSWEELFQRVKEKNLKLRGIAFHVGSLCNEPDGYYRALGMTRRCFDLALKFGLQPIVIDLGGGFFCHQEWKLPEFPEFAAAIRKGIKDFFHDQPQLHFIAEPGRLILEAATILVLTVIGRRVDQIVDEATGQKHVAYNYFMNDGVYGSFYGIPYGEYLRTEDNIISLVDDKEVPRYRSLLFGPTCDSTDTIAENLMLPELKVGDQLLATFVGAYMLKLALGGSTETTTFNGYPRPEIKHHFYPNQL